MLGNESNITQEINNSQDSPISLNDHFTHLLSKLEQDLKRLKRELTENSYQESEIKTNQSLEVSKNKNETPLEKREGKDSLGLGESKKGLEDTIEKETEGNQKIFLARHLKELEELKRISTLSITNIGDITWFLKTAIFDLMSEIPEEFSIKPLALYECMLERIKIFPKDDDFLEHKNTLLDLKNEENYKLFSLLLLKKKNEKHNKAISLLDEKIKVETERKKQNSVQSFFLALTARKRLLEAELSAGNAFFTRVKRIKLPTRISPLALPHNDLAGQSCESHENMLSQFGMKLS